MSKWTWASVLAFAAILGGGYLLLSQPQAQPLVKATEAGPSTLGTADTDVEDFDTSDDAGVDDKGDNTYDMLEDPDAAPGMTGGAPSDIEMLDDGPGTDAAAGAATPGAPAAPAPTAPAPSAAGSKP